MKDRINQLEQLSRVLEPDPATRTALTGPVIRHAQQFLEKIKDTPAFVSQADEGAGLYDSPIAETPISLEEALALLEQNVEYLGMNKLAPGDMSYIPSGGLYHAALGDYLTAVINRYTGVYYGAPGAVRMERMLLNWLAHEFGYPETAAGDLTSGGSIANLAAVVTARQAYRLKAKEFERAVVYLTGQTHHCVGKALRIAGLQECVQRRLPLDEHYRMQPAALDEAIRRDRAAGLIPWLVVASAGTTDTGAVDPLPVIAEIAHHHQLWLHVDGAYGGAFVLCRPGKQILRGIEQAGSLVVDPHKGLFMPFGTGAILVKEGAKLLEAHYYDASYLQDKDNLASRAEMSPADLSPELTRHFRGLRLWLPLKLLGVAPFRAALEEKLLLARYFHKKLAGLDGFEAGPPPDLSIVTFRYVPPRGDANEFNRQLVKAIQQDGRIFLSSTMLDGKFTIRLAVLSCHTHLAQIETALAVLQEKVRMLEGYPSKG